MLSLTPRWIRADPPIPPDPPRIRLISPQSAPDSVRRDRPIPPRVIQTIYSRGVAGVPSETLRAKGRHLAALCGSSASVLLLRYPFARLKRIGCVAVIVKDCRSQHLLTATAAS